jgi:predicted RNase H-like HicB family nuclease
MVAVNVTAVAERSGGWWAVRVPELPGVFTQARRLDQVRAMVADAVSAFLDVPSGEIKVEVEPKLAVEVSQRLEEARAERLHADRLASNASDLLRQVARALAEDGLPERDIGSILGVSHQRAHQLLTDRRAS